MSELLVLLILVWAALVLPGAVRARNTSPHVTVGGFERAMNVLRSDGSTGGAGRRLMVPADPGRIVARPVDDRTVAPGSMPREDPMIARRRTWFVRALLACAVTLALGLLVGGSLWLLFLATAAGTGGYVVVLRRLKQQRDQARQVVRRIDLEAEEVPVGQVAAGGGDAWVGSGTVRLRRWDG